MRQPRAGLARRGLTLVRSKCQAGQRRTHCVGDVVRGEVGIVAFGHAGVGMTELSRDDAHWYAPHCK